MSFPSNPIPEEVDYLVIGSGFGGSVMAAALAKATKDAGPDKKVCLLERGKAYPPGSFPRTPDGVAKNFWDPSEGLHGMFNVWSFDHMAVVVSSGLGGGSLVYANVMLEKPPEWFSQPMPGGGGDEVWSFTADDLADHYRRVREFLHVETMPYELADDGSPKTIRFINASEGKGVYAPLAVRFRDSNGNAAIGAPLPPEETYDNIFGAPRRTTCRLTGECDIGCNDGAKSSMDHTYLSEAHSNDASIHVLTEVKTIGRRIESPTGQCLFDVEYVVHGDTGPQPGTITAKRVILAAGALGTTYLMLKNAEALGLTEGPPLGSRFCGNGDLLSLAEPLSPDQDFEANRGPVITAYRQYDTDVRMTLQDGGVPTIVLWLLKTIDAPNVASRLFTEALGYVWKRIVDSNDNNLSADLSRILGGSPTIARSLPILTMGADVPDGRLSLNRHGILESSWSIKTSESYFAAVRHQVNALRQRMGAKLKAEAAPRIDQVITVHPLGGCPADTSRFSGVVDSYGRVHDVPGLWITDGSVFPGPVGVNPSLTIAAFASRAAEKLLEEDPNDPPSAAERFLLPSSPPVA
jgi:cholesterol oxidase